MASTFDFQAAMFNKPAVEERRQDEQPVLPPDPVVPTRVRVTLDNLIPYAGNPRTVRNPEYDDIKLSILNRGLDHPPNVTRPSPDQPYMIKDGGNTRLQILRELWEETGDQRFFEISCMFLPWKGERDVLIAHMIENVMRGRMTFIDCARAAARLKQYLEAEQNMALSVNQLAKQITDLGWTVHQPNLSLMLYAHDVLGPHLASTLNSGMGRPSIVTIRKYLDACERYWNSVAASEEGQFDDVWQPLFRNLDDNELFEVDLAREQLEDEIAIRLNAPIFAIRAEIQAVELGTSPGAHRPTHPEFPEIPAFSQRPASVPSRSSRSTPVAGQEIDSGNPQPSQIAPGHKGPNQPDAAKLENLKSVSGVPPVRPIVPPSRHDRGRSDTMEYTHPDPYLTPPPGAVSLMEQSLSGVESTDGSRQPLSSSQNYPESQVERETRLEHLRMQILMAAVDIAVHCGFEAAIGDPRSVRPDLKCPFFTTGKSMLAEFMADPERSSNGIAMTMYAMLSRLSSCLSGSFDEMALSDSRENDQIFQVMGNSPYAVDLPVVQILLRNARERRCPPHSLEARLEGYGAVSLTWMADLCDKVQELDSLSGQLLWAHLASLTYE